MRAFSKLLRSLFPRSDNSFIVFLDASMGTKKAGKFPQKGRYIVLESLNVPLGLGLTCFIAPITFSMSQYSGLASSTNWRNALIFLRPREGSFLIFHHASEPL